MYDVVQNRLLRWAALFLFFYSLILTLSPAVRERSWNVDYRLSHWVGYFIWLLLTTIANLASTKRLPDRDPYFLPGAALLSGWGLLTIWRLDPAFGVRQAAWLTICITLLIVMMRVPRSLAFLRQYKYVLLFGGLFLTSLTLILGTNPLGVGPRLWLGCCGVYFQPSEPLKLLLVVYLAAYLADRYPIRLTSFPLLMPTIILTGIALLLLLVQRDLGTASIFILVYTMILFIVTGRKRVLLGAIVLAVSALLTGYFFVDIIRIRVNGWINPWIDPSGDSFQIVQSLLAIANGGLAGRGPGLGSPRLVPVAISDFVYSAVAEETGLVGTIGLLLVIWLILVRGIIAALRAADRFRRLLAAGIVTYLGVQSLLIISGNLRLLPLTGVTLPFVSYGGSSLLTSFIAVAILLIISTPEDREPAPIVDPKPYLIIASVLGLGLAAAALTGAWWTLVRGADLLNRTDNARRAIADRYVPRGEIVDRNGQRINITEGESGDYRRVYLYPDLAPVTGYTHPIYGQAGIESSFDAYLRGLQGNPASAVWWERLVYGTPPPGLDLRLSIDLDLQRSADDLLGEHRGAIILMSAETGEILVMASHPSYDPNQLDLDGSELVKNISAPLLNRATQGLYPLGMALTPLVQARFSVSIPGADALQDFYRQLGMYEAPRIDLPAAFDSRDVGPEALVASPLNVLLAASTLSNDGVIPPPRIALAVDTNEQGWVILPPIGEPVAVISPSAADDAAISLLVKGKPYWSHALQSVDTKSSVTWLIGGSVPDWGGVPVALVVALEEGNIPYAEKIQELILGMMHAK